MFILPQYDYPCGPGSSVCIATGYGLDGPGIESRCWRDFSHLSRLVLGPTQPPVNGYRVFPWGKERPGRDADPSPPSSAFGHERVDLYLYSPYGPYGLYRASVPVQGCTLPLPMIILQHYPQPTVAFSPPSLEFKSPVTVQVELQHSKDSTEGRLYFPIVLESAACHVLL